MSLEATRHALIEQNAQLRVPSPVQVPLSPARAIHSGNLRGNLQVGDRLRCSREELEMEHEFPRILVRRPESRDQRVSLGHRLPPGYLTCFSLVREADREQRRAYRGDSMGT